MPERKVYRSSVTGLFVSDEYAALHPDTTQAETVDDDEPVYLPDMPDPDEGTWGADE